VRRIFTGIKVARRGDEQAREFISSRPKWELRFGVSGEGIGSFIRLLTTKHMQLFAASSLCGNNSSRLKGGLFGTLPPGIQSEAQCQDSEPPEI